MGVKNGQIAHIDRNRNHNDESNLVFLCIPHHDEYDSVRRQSKGVTPMEVLHAKSTLYTALQSQPKPAVRVTVSIEGDFHKLLPQEREALLKQVLSAAGVQGNANILEISPGSINFLVEVSSDDAELIFSAYSQSKLASVVDIRLETMSKRDVSFSSVFNAFNHGVTKRQALNVLFNPDSYHHLDCGLCIYCKKITDRYSILLIATTSVKVLVQYAMPINHSDINIPRGENPLNILKASLNKYGYAITLNGRTDSLRINEKLRLPYGVLTFDHFFSYLRQHIDGQPLEEHYELIGLFERPTIISGMAMAGIRIMFVVSKGRYYPSLERLGLAFNRGKLGSHISRG